MERYNLGPRLKWLMIALQGACVSECVTTRAASQATKGSNFWLLFVALAAYTTHNKLNYVVLF